MGKVNSKLHSELETIRLQDSEKVLRPEAVVEYARQHKDSFLHAQFAWDDEEAAKLLQQARDAIKEAVVPVALTTKQVAGETK